MGCGKSKPKSKKADVVPPSPPPKKSQAKPPSQRQPQPQPQQQQQQQQQQQTALEAAPTKAVLKLPTAALSVEECSTSSTLSYDEAAAAEGGGSPTDKDVPENSQESTCEECGAELKPPFQFCTRCGNSVQDDIKNQTDCVLASVFRKHLEDGSLQTAVKAAAAASDCGRPKDAGVGGQTKAGTEVQRAALLESRSYLRDGSLEEIPSGTPLILGRYQLLGKILGEGGCFKVVLAADTQANGLKVALKTCHKQGLRDLGDEVQDHFAKEVAGFRRLGMSKQHGLSETMMGWAESIRVKWSPQDVFVEMLDFSRMEGDSDALRPGPVADGRCHSVLELGDETLGAFIERRCRERDFVALEEIKLLARCLGIGLTYLHRLNLVHCSVTPNKVMRFGSTWKFIDIDGAQPATGGVLSTSRFKPLYAAPEIGRAVLGDAEVMDGSSTVVAGLEPSPKMDVWAAGVMILDVLGHRTAFAEVMAGFQAQGLGSQQKWYEYLVDSQPIKVLDYISAVPSSTTMYQSSPELCSLLEGLLEKTWEARLSSEDFVAHPFLALNFDRDAAAGIEDLVAASVPKEKRRKSRKASDDFKDKKEKEKAVKEDGDAGKKKRKKLRKVTIAELPETCEAGEVDIRESKHKPDAVKKVETTASEVFTWVDD